jgi:AcrR family transcriptional regulator
MAESIHLGHPTGIDRRQTGRRITASAIQQIAEPGYINVTITAIADGAGVSNAAVREHITGEYLAQHRAGDASGRLGEARNV